MSARYSRIGRVVGKSGVPELLYRTAHDFGGNFT